MTRSIILMLPALALACQAIDDTDSTSEPTVETTFAATLNTYGWSGDDVVLESTQEIEGAAYEATNGDEALAMFASSVTVNTVF